MTNKFMRRYLRGLLVGGVCVSFGAVYAQARILTVLSDKGMSGTDLYTWGPGVFVSSSAVSVGAPEGQYTVLSQGPSWNGFGVVYNPNGVDLSAFDASHQGALRFWLYSNSDDLTLSLEHTSPGTDCQGMPGNEKDCWSFLGTELGQVLNQWVLIELPLSAVRVDDLYSPFELTANSGATFYVDDVRYIDGVSEAYDPNATAISPIFRVTVNNVSDQQPASQLTLTWPPQVPLSGWVRSNQYIQLEVDGGDSLTWGVQMYTANTSPDANPKFIITDSSSNPAGMVYMPDPHYEVPLAWSIKPSLQSPSVAIPPAAEPNNNGGICGSGSIDPHAYQWLYMQDVLSPNLPLLCQAGFQNGNLVSVVKNNVGIHYGQMNTEFGAEDPPNYIFLEANFGVGFAGQTYQTNSLIVEIFYY